jgi:hypothetical protein
LLRRIVDSHSHIACPPESKFILPLVTVLDDRKAMAGWDSMGYARSDVVRALSEFIGGFFMRYAAAQGKPRWADKTPNYVDCLPYLWELFGPDARFILIVRHGMDVAVSLADPHRHYPVIDHYMASADNNAPVAAGLFWADKTQKLEDFRLAHPQACFQIRYEDLTANPETSLKAMFDFVEEPWEPHVLDYGSFPHHEGFGDPDVKRRRTIELNSGKYRRWPVEVQRAVRDACGPLLTKLGYE